MRATPELDAHILALKFKTYEDYFQWCKNNRFRTAIYKGPDQLKKEKVFYKEQIFSATLKKNNACSFESGLEALRNNRPLSSSTDNVLKAIIDVIVSRKASVFNRAVFFDLIAYLYKKTKILESPTFIVGIALICDYHSMWIRDYKDWIPKSYNPEKQFGSLLRHLFCQYPVPVFMDAAWRVNCIPKHIEWFLHIGDGNNIRTAQGLPFELTKKQAHHFLEAPDDWGINEAFWYGVLIAQGGSQRLANALRPTRLMNSFQDKAFSVSVIQFFIDNSMLDLDHVQPIIDYIWNQKYTNQRVFVARGVVEERPPEQPNFSMNGRRPETLLAQVEQWHKKLGKESKGGTLEWEKDPQIKDFKWTVGSKTDPKQWKITELLNSKELSAEGRVMHHCVVSYASSCAHGRCSIWSMTLNDSKLVTIEVRNKMIVQVRGLYNRRPTQQEDGVIQRWAQQEGLSLKYLDSRW